MKISISEIEARALSLRKKYDIQTYGIKDIFGLVEQMNIDLIRYPFGKNVLCGFATVYEGKKVIVSNSSEILSREIFTIAHELGHIEYDVIESNLDIKIDIDLFNDEKELDIAEKRARYFAGCFLMPKNMVRRFAEEVLKKEFNELSGLDIIRMQTEFNVSYDAVITRLEILGFIKEEQKNKLHQEKISRSLRQLFKTTNADERLLDPTEEIKVPARYFEYVISNYNNGYIPFSSLEKALKLIGVDAEVFKKDSVVANDEISIDELFEEF